VDGSIVLVGAGGIGAPAAWALAAGGAAALTIVDEDAVELGNLHRQILFEDADVGRLKTAALAGALAARFPGCHVVVVDGRALPDTALALARRAAVLVDATDNFASRFLLADAARLAAVPVVHAAAVRWHATVMCALSGGRPCYRCLFEDLPAGATIDCATAGVAGPVCGVAGAIAADRALRLVAGDASAAGHVVTYDGLADRLRQVPVAARPDCPLCGAQPTIGAIDANRYMGETICETGGL
jgi:molybdopterin/thiamine biosynthesis adenylyltransferase